LPTAQANRFARASGDVSAARHCNHRYSQPSRLRRAEMDTPLRYRHEPVVCSCTQALPTSAAAINRAPMRRAKLTRGKTRSLGTEHAKVISVSGDDSAGNSDPTTGMPWRGGGWMRFGSAAQDLGSALTAVQRGTYSRRSRRCYRSQPVLLPESSIIPFAFRRVVVGSGGRIASSGAIPLTRRKRADIA
jgi:hypothetical protein